MLSLFENLLKIPSPSGQETEMAEYVFGLLQQMGFEVRKQFVDDKRFNVIATTQKTPAVLFCTHMDTVEPQLPVQIDGDIVRARGACDAKGALFSMLLAADQLLKENVEDFGLLFVVGEETNSDGAKKASELSLDSQCVILGEPTENKLAIGQKGTIVFRIEASGTAGHSAYPEAGDSAINRLVDVLNHLSHIEWGSDDILGETTLNIGLLEGGSGANVIADRAYAEGIFRVANDLDVVLKKLLSFETEKLKITIASQSEPQLLSRLHGFETTVVAFGSDAAYLRPLGQVFLIGPGSVRYAHSDREQITMTEINEASKIYERMVKTLLAERVL